MTITPETITNLEEDCIHIAEIAVGKEGGNAGGVSINTSTDRLGQVKKTLPKILEEMQDTTISVLQLKNDLANDTDPAKGAGMVGAYDGRTIRDELESLSLPLSRFGATENGDAAQNSLALNIAISEASASGKPIYVDGLYAIDGDTEVPSNITLFGINNRTQGFNLEPQSSSITGGVHGYFKLNPNQNVDSVVFKNLVFNSSYDSTTFSGSTVFPVIKVAPNSGFTHSNLVFDNLVFIDPVVDCIDLAPQGSGIVDGVLVSKCRTSVTSLTKASRASDLIRSVIDYPNAPSHATNYGARQIKNVKVQGCHAEGIRTLADLKRGTSGFIVDCCTTKNLSDCHYSCDGAFDGIFSNLVGSQDSADLPNKNFIEIQGEDINVDKFNYSGSSSYGAIAGVMVTAYASTSESITAFHQSKRVRITRGKIAGSSSHAIRLLDTIDCSVDDVDCSDIALHGCALEHPAAASNGGANTAVGYGNSVSRITAGSSVGGVGVKINVPFTNTTVGDVRGFARKTEGLGFAPAVHSNQNVNPAMFVGSTGECEGWYKSGTVNLSNSSTKPMSAVTSILVDGTNATNLDQLIMNNCIPVVFGDVVGVRLKTMYGSATDSGVLFQELDASGAFIANDFQQLISHSSEFIENVLYHKRTNQNCAFVRVILQPNASWNNGAAIGSSYFADVVVTNGTP